MSDTELCEHCAGPTTFAAELPRLGDEPGHRIWWCAGCKRYTWKAVRFMQQQQQQPRN